MCFKSAFLKLLKILGAHTLGKCWSKIGGNVASGILPSNTHTETRDNGISGHFFTRTCRVSVPPRLSHMLFGATSTRLLGCPGKAASFGPWCYACQNAGQRCPTRQNGGVLHTRYLARLYHNQENPSLAPSQKLVYPSIQRANGAVSETALGRPIQRRAPRGSEGIPC